jgi:ABC-type multidrug transport system, ATPase and permease components
LSFSVRKGEIVALVGATGAGKSTIVQLLPRLYEVQKGQIRIDGVPIDSLTQKSLRDQIAFVPQRPFLFLIQFQKTSLLVAIFRELRLKKPLRELTLMNLLSICLKIRYAAR